MIDGLKVMLIEDDPAVRMGSEQALKLAGLDVQAFPSAVQARKHLAADFPGVVVTDVKLPGMDGLELLRHIKTVDATVPVILVTGHGDITMAVQAMRDGAYDFIEKPFSSDRLVNVVQRALEKRSLTLEVQSLSQRLENRTGIEAAIIGRSQAIERIRRLILDVADTPTDVLVYGETGTGKELVARCLHQHSKRRHGQFVAVNCGAIPEPLFESEMFGHESGAFTGAAKRRIGKMEFAADGTLFLDEIESMPQSLQVKLLRALQERRIERLGSNESVPIDVRVVAAAQQDLKKLGDKRQFRSDLYYRLNVVVLELPPLRERREDIPMLFEHCQIQASLRYNRIAPILTGAQMRELIAYSWPGNVRELRNVADRFALGLLGDKIDPLQSAKVASSPLAEQVDRFERCLIEEQLRKNSGSVSCVSEALSLPKKTLYDKMHKYGLVAEEYRQS